MPVKQRPPVPGLPSDPRAFVYAPDELFDPLGEGYQATSDAPAYAWFRQTKANGDIFASMLRAVHDDAISDALDERLIGAHVVGVMGGHAMAGGTEAYAGAAHLGRELARAGFTVATGGGPGAMEAAPTSARTPRLSRTPCSTRPSDFSPRHPRSCRPYHRLGAGGLRAARPLNGRRCLGRRPDLVLRARTAEPVRRAHRQVLHRRREHGLLARCNAGVVFLPGAAGTVQQILDNATPHTASRVASPP